MTMILIGLTLIINSVSVSYLLDTKNEYLVNAIININNKIKGINYTTSLYEDNKRSLIMISILILIIPLGPILSSLLFYDKNLKK